VICEHGETWWKDVDREELVIRPPELPGNPMSILLWYQALKTGEGNDEFGFAKYFYSYLQVIFLRGVNPTWYLPALLPIRRKVCCGFLSPLKIHRLCWV
jgi:hypothetical protein